MIYGLDPVTGARLWRRRAATAVGTHTVWVSEIGQSVAYFRPTGAARVARLVLADPRTGADA